MAFKWYDNIAVLQKPIVQSMGLWLNKVRWQQFITAEFPTGQTKESSVKGFRDFINQLERQLRSRVGYVASFESKSKGGRKVSIHVHAVLTSHKQMTLDATRAHWLSGCGRKRFDASRNHVLIHAETFHPHLRGVEYVVKMMACEDAELEFGWLNFFHPDIELSSASMPKPTRTELRWARVNSKSPICPAPETVLLHNAGNCFY